MRRRAGIPLVTMVVLTGVISLGSTAPPGDRPDVAAATRNLCRATRALVNRSAVLRARLNDPTPDGYDRVALRTELANDLRRTGDSASAAARYLRGLPAAREERLAFRTHAAVVALSASGAKYRALARAVRRFPTQDRDDWNAAVLALSTRSSLAGGDAALRDLKRAALEGHVGAAIARAAVRSPECVGAL